MRRIFAAFAAAAVSFHLFAAPIEQDRRSDEGYSAVSVIGVAHKAFHAANEDVNVTFRFTNDGASAVAIPNWMLGASNIDRSFIRVTRDGAPLEYTGALVKRAAPTINDMVIVQPGESIDVGFELSAFFDMRAGGQLEVEFVNNSKHFVDGLALNTMPFAINVEASPFAGERRQIEKAGGAGGISFTGSCSASRQTSLRDAVNAASAMAADSVSYLNAGKTGSRYTTWFGTYSATRYSTVKSHFANIQSAIDTKPITLDCSCTEAGTYAYVYPTQPYKIYLCGAFWSAGLTGTDSKGGTIVHEMSHFTVNGGTSDHAYGQTAAKSLARKNPNKAVMNADSHEYFAENTPFLQ